MTERDDGDDAQLPKDGLPQDGLPQDGLPKDELPKDGLPKDQWPPKQSGRRKLGDGHPAAEHDDQPPPSERVELPGGVELQSATRRAFGEDDAPARVNVLQGVQGRLRERSGGKFYGDGWSTTKHPPFATFFITSLMMLAIIAIVYAILVPLVGDPVELPKQPEPVNVIPP